MTSCFCLTLIRYITYDLTTLTAVAQLLNLLLWGKLIAMNWLDHLSSCYTQIDMERGGSPSWLGHRRRDPSVSPETLLRKMSSR